MYSISQIYVLLLIFIPINNVINVGLFSNY